VRFRFGVGLRVEAAGKGLERTAAEQLEQAFQRFFGAGEGGTRGLAENVA
jgi:hypothetical protein